MALEPALLDILRCPDEHHAQLRHDVDADTGAQTLTCVECHRVFEVVDGLPVLLLDGPAAEPSAAEPSAGEMP